MTKSASLEQHLCPCGEESVNVPYGLHVIGPRCRAQVATQVRRRFGPARFGGRYAADVEDIIQECYRNLVAPTGLGMFQAPDDGVKGRAFRAWLWRVVHNYCNNKADYLRRQLAVGTNPLKSVHESRHAITPEQAFARERIRELVEVAVREIEPGWRTTALMSERFDVILQLLSEQESHTERARERLGVTGNHLRQLKWKLQDEIRRELRKQIMDDLFLEPGIDRETVDCKIDREIGALFEAAYSVRGEWDILSARPPLDSMAQDDQWESQP
ncbi:MAG TPA: hypothetical protein VIM73_22845 [Polyangiaceae bacterium]